VIEDASELVRNAEAAAAEKESLYKVARKTNSELAWDKGLLLGQVESLKREVGKNKERTTELGAAKEEAIRLRAELKEAQRVAGMSGAEQSEKEAKLKASLERKTVKKRQWKVKCAEKGETVRVNADAHATEVAALRIKKLEETEHLRSAIEEAKNMYDRQLEGQLAEIHRLRNLLVSGQIHIGTALLQIPQIHIDTQLLRCLRGMFW
jgi:chromosome segregation ATPase